MSSLFTRIIKGELPSHKVWEDDRHIAFLDITPIQPGHTLVVPKREIPYLFDLSPYEQSSLWEAVRKVEGALRRATGCLRVCLMVVGWEVPHAHVHLVPTNHVGEFAVPPKVAQTQEQLAATARAIQLEI